MDPTQIEEIRSTGEFHLRGAVTEEVLRELSAIPELQVLWLHGNQLTELPDAIGELKQLTQLWLHDNQLSELPDAIGELEQLAHLTLHGNQLRELPTRIEQLEHLTYLSLDGNPLKEVPPAIRALGRLTVLSLQNNELRDLPDWIGGLEHLTRLWLGDNKLRELPAEIAELGELTALSLQGNHFTALPAAIGELEQLTGLSLDDNHLTEVPRWIGNLEQLTGLSLKNNQLTELPAAIGKLTNLTQLWLAYNQLSELPDEICNLVQLTQLWLAGNQLTELPDEIGDLQELNLLSLHGNRLRGLPDSVGDLQQLSQIRLDRNQLSEVPPALERLGRLSMLSLHDNQLTELPAWIGGLQQLNMLSLAANRLRELPAEIGGLTGLTQLSLHGNELRELPASMGELRQLSLLTLHRNPLTSPSPSIVSQGTEAVLEYLRGLQGEPERRWISKLLVVGEGGVGKTQLLRSLAGEDFEEQSESTHGIAIRPLEFAHPEEGGVRMTLKCWDFGGQEIYHATHQFFLSDRSLFVVVWNARLGWEQGKLTYWLDTIRSLAPESPVVLVATHADQREPVLPIQELAAEYPIAASLGISNARRTGIEELRVEIASAVSKLPLMGEKWPKTWLQAAEAIEARRTEKHCTLKQVEDEMQRAGVRDSDCDTLLRWLHDLGEIVHFEEDDELRDTVMLDPQWVSKQVSAVLESDLIQTGLGVFKREHMNVVWPDVGRDVAPRLLALMQRFDLSYVIPEDPEHKSLVVERLSHDPPENLDEVWAEAGDGAVHLSMDFDLKTTRPAGVPTWFIARSHRFTTHMHWRYGAMLRRGDSGNVGLLRTRPDSKVVRLEAKGPAPQSFFAVLRDLLELTLDRFPGLQVERRIPCPGHGSPCSHEFLLEEAENALGWKNPQLQCPKSGEMIPVSQILFGVHHSTMEAQLVRMEAKIDEQKEMTRESIELLADLYTLTAREFTGIFNREQRRVESHCPRVFTLRPVDGSALADSKKLLSTPWKLRLYCEEPGQWHPQPDAVWAIQQPGEWVRAAMPFAKKVVEKMKFAVPVAAASCGVVDATALALMKDEVGQMKDLVGALPNVEGMDLNTLERHGRKEPGELEGADLRELRGLIEHLAGPLKHSRLGGLRKVLTPEGHYYWLCERHAAQY